MSHPRGRSAHTTDMNDDMVPLVGFCGRKGSGKDTAAQALLEHGWELVAFAEPLKAMAYAVNPKVEVPAGVTRRWPEGVVLPYQVVVDALGLDVAKYKVPDVREFLQRLGSEGVRDHLGESTWADIAVGRYRASVAPGVAITDARFLDEVEAVRRHGGLLVRVVRPSLGEATDLHRSEHALDDVEPDVTLVNDADVATLRTRLVVALARRGVDLSGRTAVVAA